MLVFSIPSHVFTLNDPIIKHIDLLSIALLDWSLDCSNSSRSSISVDAHLSNHPLFLLRVRCALSRLSRRWSSWCWIISVSIGMMEEKFQEDSILSSTACCRSIHDRETSVDGEGTLAVIQSHWWLNWFSKLHRSCVIFNSSHAKLLFSFSVQRHSRYK